MESPRNIAKILAVGTVAGAAGFAAEHVRQEADKTELRLEFDAKLEQERQRHTELTDSQKRINLELSSKVLEANQCFERSQLAEYYVNKMPGMANLVMSGCSGMRWSRNCDLNQLMVIDDARRWLTDNQDAIEARSMGIDADIHKILEVGRYASAYCRKEDLKPQARGGVLYYTFGGMESKAEGLYPGGYDLFPVFFEQSYLCHQASILLHEWTHVVTDTAHVSSEVTEQATDWIAKTGNVAAELCREQH